VQHALSAQHALSVQHALSAHSAFIVPSQALEAAAGSA